MCSGNAQPAWPPNEVVQSRYDLDELDCLVELNRAGHVNEEDNDWLSKLLVVKSCGHIEITTTECILEFLRRHSDSMLHAYLESGYISWKSPRPDYLKKTMGRLCEPMKSDLANYLKETRDDKTNTEWLGQLVDSRAKIAHGKSLALRVGAAIDLYRFAISFGDWYISYFAPDGDAERYISVQTH